ncbi:hypothetical protein LEMLEM_LOCUS12801 [Lemmus lemmus]
MSELPGWDKPAPSLQQCCNPPGVSCSPNGFQTHYITEDDLDLWTCLLPLSKSWDYRLAPPCPLNVVLGMNPGLLACLED